jgi:glycosyltransferase involved in cell wall biosynthesis
MGQLRLVKGQIRNMRKRRIWITWEDQRRNRTLSRALEAELFQFDIKLNRLIRYPVALFKTLLTFLKTKPNLLFAQNPSLLLAFFGVNYGKIFGIPVIIDSHNAGVLPFDGRRRLVNRIAIYIIKNSTLTIVTNDGLKNYVDQIGGRSFVLPDPIPSFDDLEFHYPNLCLQGKYNVLFICSYAPDEPYQEVLKAAKGLKEGIVIYMTGNSKGKVDSKPENVVLTGYLPEHDYVRLLHAVDVVMDLTTRKDCLVCGAYEAVAAEKPVILSDTKTLRDHFYKGALYVDNTAADLVKKINYTITNLDKLKEEIKELKKERIESWSVRKRMFEKLLDKL